MKSHKIKKNKQIHNYKKKTIESQEKIKKTVVYPQRQVKWTEGRKRYMLHIHRNKCECIMY